MIELLSIMLWAATVENIVFSRAFGSGRVLSETGKPHGMRLFSAMLIFMMVVSALICDPMNTLAKRYYPSSQIGGAVLITLSLTLIYAFFSLLLWILSPRTYRLVACRWAVASFNSALLGCAMVISGKNYTVLQDVAYAVGGAVGFLLAMKIVQEGKRRLAISRIPRIFRGFPATFIYIGLVSLAFYGLLGHQLPV